MIVGVHNFVDALSTYKDEVTSSEGGMWIVLMDGLLLIPFAMAAFFYPFAALMGLGVALAFSVLAVVATRMYRLRHPHVEHPDAPDRPAV